MDWFELKTIELALQALEEDPKLQLSVNIDPDPASHDTFLDDVKILLSRHRDAASRLTMELTENGRHIADSALIHFIDKMHREDISVLLDDVGNGRFDLERINPDLIGASDGIKYPLSKVMVWCAPQNRANGLMMRSMIGLAHMVKDEGKSVTLEGVVDISTLASWSQKKLPFDYVQPHPCGRLQRQIQQQLNV